MELISEIISQANSRGYLKYRQNISYAYGTVLAYQVGSKWIFDFLLCAEGAFPRYQWPTCY
jgi:hypothetical protein